MILQNPKGNRRMRIGADNFMYFSTKVDGRWLPWQQHFSQYNGLMEYNEAKHFLGWHELKPAL